MRRWVTVEENKGDRTHTFKLLYNNRTAELLDGLNIIKFSREIDQINVVFLKNLENASKL